MDNVTSIKRGRKFHVQTEAMKEPPYDSPEAKEERYLEAMLTGSRLMSKIEKHEVDQVIVFSRSIATGQWLYDYANVNSPGHVIEALAPLYHSARAALSVREEG